MLNKCDLVDEEWLELMEEETREKLQGTIMEHAPIVRVSAATGEGIDELKDVILNMVKNEVEERDVNSIPRLPIDRVFTISGFGTIVTGTLISGTINKSDTLELFPIGKSVRSVVSRFMRRTRRSARRDSALPSISPISARKTYTGAASSRPSEACSPPTGWM